MQGRFPQYFSIIYCLLFLMTPSFAAQPTFSNPYAIAPDGDNTQFYDQPVQNLFLTSTVGPLQKNQHQLLAEPTYGQANQANETEIQTLYSYGLNNHWQLGVEWEAYLMNNSQAGQHTSGPSDLSFFSEYSFTLIHHSTYSAALLFFLTYPNGSVSRGLSDGYIHYEPSLILAKDFPSFNDSQIFAEISLNIPQNRSNLNPSQENPALKTSTEFNVGFYIPNGRFVFSTECSFESNNETNVTGNNVAYIAPGLIWNFNAVLEVGLAPAFGLTQSSDHYQIIGFLSATLG